MKLQVTQANLSKALNTVARIANSRNPLAILSNVLLKTESNRLSIAATNLDIGITHFIGSKIEKEGAITVPARLMQDFVSSLPDSVLNLELTDNKLKITTDQYQSTINGIVAQDLLRIINDAQKQITVTHDDQQVLFNVGDINLVARLIEGNYPDYRKLIPTKFETIAKLSRADFLNITKVSSLFARESAGSITIKADKDDKSVSINAIASQLGENTAKATAKITGGGEITLNSRYLIEALNAFSAAEIEFCFNGKLEPIILRSATEPNYLHLIMPLRS
jgi:DNA polymerase III sliding clamp (beta) subunit (PCNA family)